MNLGDPELELIDPTPNVHSLFIHFDKTFFWTKLASRAVVRWSKRMYSCAGVCSYEGRGGLCDIALSEPLLKLRPRKDLVETLLHEMIHAFLFVTNKDQDRDGHGPNFKEHMFRINKSAGLNISIYHSFHEEVELYYTHWWRCNGPCQKLRPHYGLVRRTMNKAPGPNDYWWNDHMRKCGGTFVKIKEPQKQQKTKGKKTTTTTKPNADITKYITSNIKTINNVPNRNTAKPVLKDTSNVKANTKSISSSTVVVSKKGAVFNPTTAKPPSQPTPVFTGNGHTLNTGSKHYTIDVTETVRNIWANKQLSNVNEPSKKVNPSVLGKKPIKSMSVDTGTFNEPAKRVGTSNPNKHKADSATLQSPPTKMKKIDDYFNASTILKNLYGDDYKLAQSNSNTKLVAVNVKAELVDCPICSGKYSNDEINRHLDECLNKDIIEKLSKDAVETVREVKPKQTNTNGTSLKERIGLIQTIPAYANSNYIIDLTHSDFDNNINTDRGKRKTDSHSTLASLNIDKLVNKIDEAHAKKVQANTNNVPHDKKRRNTVSFITTSRGDAPNEIYVKEFDKVLEKDEFKPGPSTAAVFDHICPCCGKKFDKPVEEHLDECLMFFDNKTTIPDEGASTSYSNNTTVVVEDEDDIFDESQVLNATGTKTPCPVCMKMVEQDDMNGHLDLCLQ